MEQLRVVRFGRSDWNILLMSLLLCTNNSKPGIFFQWAYYTAVIFVDWNVICIMLFQQKQFIWGKINFLCVNIELEGLIRLLVFLVGSLMYKMFISLLLIQLTKLPEKTQNILIPFNLKVKAAKRKLLKSENSSAVMTCSLVITVLWNPNVNMFLIELQTTVCISCGYGYFLKLDFIFSKALLIQKRSRMYCWSSRQLQLILGNILHV